MFRLVRRRTVGAKTSEEVVYGITSLSREEAGAGRLSELSRARRGIENVLHHTRDETFREGRRRVRRGQAARVLASLRNVAVYVPGASRPEQVLRELCTYLGVDFEPAMLQYETNDEGPLVMGLGDWSDSGKLDHDSDCQRRVGLWNIECRPGGLAVHHHQSAERDYGEGNDTAVYRHWKLQRQQHSGSDCAGDLDLVRLN